MESAMIRWQTWPCPCPRLILWNGSKSCSPCADIRVRTNTGERWKKIEKNGRKRDYVDVTRGVVALRSVR